MWVQNAALLTWYATRGAESTARPASGVWVKKGNTVTWTSLPGGIYNVYSPRRPLRPSTCLKTEAVNASAGDGISSYP